jgi:cytochrome c biogenesis protein CcmG/thiol:disulfide interchange protein DsbE
LNDKSGAWSIGARVAVGRASLGALVLFAIVGCFVAPARAAPPPELGEIKGKLVWVDFWASWCAPCRRSFPWLNEIQARYGRQGLEVIGVNLDNERSAADKFLKDVPARFTLRFDPAGKLAEKFDVQAMPSSFLLDSSGNVLASHAGFRLADSAKYESEIRNALAGGK